jgi:hypothetical protein
VASPAALASAATFSVGAIRVTFWSALGLAVTATVERRFGASA